MENLLDEIPGYKEAVAQETFNRDASFLDLTETVGGVELRSMTLLDFLRLDIAKSPFLHGGIPTATDIAVFCWALSPGYDQQNHSARHKYVKTLRRLLYADIVPAIERYIDETFADAPGGAGIAGIPITSWLAGMVDSIASQYHWSEQMILKLPLKRLFQYRRLISKRMNPQSTFFNPSDKVRGAWLNRLNGQN